MTDTISKDFVVEAKQELAEVRESYRQRKNEFLEDITDFSELEESSEILNECFVPMQNWIDEYWEPLHTAAKRFSGDNPEYEKVDIFEVLRSGIRAGYIELASNAQIEPRQSIKQRRKYESDEEFKNMALQNTGAQ